MRLQFFSICVLIVTFDFVSSPGFVLESQACAALTTRPPSLVKRSCLAYRLQSQRRRPPFPMERRPSSLVGSYSNPGWGNKILLRERPAHQCRNGSDLSILFASDAPTDLSRFRIANQPLKSAEPASFWSISTMGALGHTRCKPRKMASPLKAGRPVEKRDLKDGRYGDRTCDNLLVREVLYR